MGRQSITYKMSYLQRKRLTNFWPLFLPLCVCVCVCVCVWVCVYFLLFPGDMKSEEILILLGVITLLLEKCDIQNSQNSTNNLLYVHFILWLMLSLNWTTDWNFSWLRWYPIFNFLMPYWRSCELYHICLLLLNSVCVCNHDNEIKPVSKLCYQLLLKSYFYQGSSR